MLTFVILMREKLQTADLVVIIDVEANDGTGDPDDKIDGLMVMIATMLLRITMLRR